MSTRDEPAHLRGELMSASVLLTMSACGDCHMAIDRPPRVGCDACPFRSQARPGSGSLGPPSVARALCEVLVPPKLRRPTGERVDSGVRDATHSGEWLRLDEFTRARVSCAAEEAARDLGSSSTPAR